MTPTPSDLTVSPSRAFLLGHEATPIGPTERPGPFDIVFLDRDGTINVHRPGYVTRVADFTVIDGALEAIARFNAAGARVVLVTNQRGLSTGLLGEDELATVHGHLVAEAARVGARLDAIFVCPHDHGTCDCRKPLPGLLTRAFGRMTWASPARCVLVGDQPTDVAAADAAGVRSLLVDASEFTLRDAAETLLCQTP